MNPVRTRPSDHPAKLAPAAAPNAETRSNGPDEIERLLTESHLIGVVEFARDTWVVDCNDTIARMLGYDTRRDVRGRHASELFFESVEFVRSLAGLLPGDTLQREVRMRSQDGSMIRVAAHVLCRPDDLPQSAGFLATFIPLPAGPPRPHPPVDRRGLS